MGLQVSAPTLVLRLFFLTLFGLFVGAQQSDDNTWEYIVVGSGPGGGPLAANLALAGHSVLLLEAGDDQGDNPNVTQTFNANAATNDPATRWDFFVKHFSDEEAEAQYKYMTYRNSDGSFYVGLNPPAGAEKLGVWYPRAGTLGGCAMHNAAVATLPQDSDWQYIADITGDNTWAPASMRTMYERLEKCNYMPQGSEGHGFNGWLETSQNGAFFMGGNAPIASAAAQAAGQDPNQLQALLSRDINGPEPNRDQETGIFGATSHTTSQGTRSSPNTYVRSVFNDQSNPLSVQLTTLVTKILFDEEAETPTAIGVEWLYGPSMYSADPRYDANAQGETGQSFATKGVIISGGVFNSPQILKLSGIGPAAELEQFDIPVVVDLPGVGENMADNYEGGVLGQWQQPLQSPLFVDMVETSVAEGGRDMYMWCGAFSFEGFWPGFPNNYQNQYECAFAHMQPHSQAGTVRLRSADPRDTPDINLRFFENGADTDLQAMVDTVELARGFFANVQGNQFTELHPCEGVSGTGGCADDEQKEYLKLQIYSHHATSSCAIGADDDPMAVLDSKFRVRGVNNLRVVDGSAFPKVPGAFPVLPTMMLAEKATDAILDDA
ncbi:hypothetical protein BDY21DRAFT_286343 [Lineolata rhizophorae]|uniref:Glucose-methanol-choline oxidoreductase N-terminal domain-containing protein n=1 Tax=Lineolata rhizophorae TaxID=578093 RepID=A0A6A6P064_9PEZI|nr:hypothetical protein BDY21DRAFT_286343 [Lineolata rhizophorae]